MPFKSNKAALPFMSVRPQTTPNVQPNAAAPAPPLSGRSRESVAIDEPEDSGSMEKRTVPPELPNALFHMAGRGGWNRVSMNTVQSDDKRFTITQIDPTRRIKTFMLKDLDLGESYEERTMTDAKRKAKYIRDRANRVEVRTEETPQALPEYTPTTALVASFSNQLLKKAI